MFDVDPALATRTRDALLAELGGADIPVGCGHFAEAAFGRIPTGEGKRNWQPQG